MSMRTVTTTGIMGMSTQDSRLEHATRTSIVTNDRLTAIGMCLTCIIGTGTDRLDTELRCYARAAGFARPKACRRMHGG